MEEKSQNTPKAGTGPNGENHAIAPQYRASALSHRKPTRFRWQPNAMGRAALAQSLGLQAIKSFTFQGEITPEGRADFRLNAEVRAHITQSCVITWEPVEAQISEQITRRYMAEWVEPDAEELELTEDDSNEPIPEVVDIAAIATEALSLALPLYPRAPGATLGEAVYAAEGEAPLRDDDLKPFSALAHLLKKSQEGTDEGA